MSGQISAGSEQFDQQWKQCEGGSPIDPEDDLAVCVLDTAIEPVEIVGESDAIVGPSSERDLTQDELAALTAHLDLSPDRLDLGSSAAAGIEGGEWATLCIDEEPRPVLITSHWLPLCGADLKIGDLGPQLREYLTEAPAAGPLGTRGESAEEIR